jgi:hypothetical protein
VHIEAALVASEYPELMGLNALPEETGQLVRRGDWRVQGLGIEVVKHVTSPLS